MCIDHENKVIADIKTLMVFFQGKDEYFSNKSQMYISKLINAIKEDTIPHEWA